MRYELELLEARVLLSAGASLNDTLQWPKIRSAPDGIVVATTLWDESGVCLTKLTDRGVGDPTFGMDGTTILNGTGPVCQVTVQPDGKVLVLTAGPLQGFERLFRLDVDGGLDSTFGEAGQVTLGDAYGSWVWATGDIVVAADGKIVVVGQADDPDGEDVDLTFYRFSSTGQADETFGDQGETRIRGSSDFYWIGDAQIGADGTISACGDPWGLSTYIVQLDGQGQPVPGFGKGGVLIRPNSPGEDALFWSDGTLLITNEMSAGLTLRRTTVAGQPVVGFGNNGTATLFDPEEGDAFLYGLVGLSDGTIVLVAKREGAPWDSIIVVRPDGSLDATFGGGAGYVALPHPGDTLNHGGTWDLDVDGQGRVLYLSPPITGADGNVNLEVTRLAADGSLDGTFAEGGVALLHAEEIVGAAVPPLLPAPSTPSPTTPSSTTPSSTAQEDDDPTDVETEAPIGQPEDAATEAVAVAPSLSNLPGLTGDRLGGLFNSDRPILGVGSDNLFD
jgi:uncharacterized delta-60 repeat protein